MASLRTELANLYRIPKNVLNFLRSYPTKGGEFNMKYMVIVLSFQLYCLNDCIFSVYCGWPDIIEVAVNLCAVICCIVCSSKYLNYMYYRKQFSKLFLTVEEHFWAGNESSSEEEKNILRSYGRFCYYFTTFQVISMCIVAPVWIIEPILQMNGILPRYGKLYDLILPFEVWLPSSIDGHAHPVFDSLSSLMSGAEYSFTSFEDCWSLSTYLLANYMLEYLGTTNHLFTFDNY